MSKSMNERSLQAPAEVQPMTSPELGELHGSEISIDDQIAAIEREIQTCKHSWTDLIGEHKGTIPDPDDAHHVAILKSAKRTLEAVKRLIKLPNLQNRVGPWKDVNDAIRRLRSQNRRAEP